MRSEDTTQRDGTAKRDVSRGGRSTGQVEAQSSETLRRSVSLGRTTPRQPAPLNGRLRRMAQSALRGETGAGLSIGSRKIPFPSSGTGTHRPSGGPIRKNIIGHRMASGIAAPQEQFFGGRRFGRSCGPLALSNQQAREHGAGVFFEPLIKQGGNFLLEIGRVIETREFVALKRIAGSREKELPGRLGFGTGHRRLLEER
jgi:hypothetical protein